MGNDKQIYILKRRIAILEQKNEQLKAENERLNSRLSLETIAEKESRSLANEMLFGLRTKKAEYEQLVSECEKLRNAYQESADEMRRLTCRYREDVRHAAGKQFFNKLSRFLYRLEVRN